jgi:hypothetical protein
MAIGDWTEKVAADFITHAPACAGPLQHYRTIVEPPRLCQTSTAPGAAGSAKLRVLNQVRFTGTYAAQVYLQRGKQRYSETRPPNGRLLRPHHQTFSDRAASFLAMSALVFMPFAERVVLTRDRDEGGEWRDQRPSAPANPNRCRSTKYPILMPECSCHSRHSGVFCRDSFRDAIAR